VAAPPGAATRLGFGAIQMTVAATSRGVVVRVLQDFWRLYDAVAGSSLRFSIIRKRNAEPRRG
jgi:hypothetical protein